MNEPRPRISRRQITDRKCLCIMAISFSGKCCFKILDPFQTLNAQGFQSFLQIMIHNFNRHVNPLSSDEMILIMDNARPHISNQSLSYLRKKGIYNLRQPPYSPDYNLMDRFIFSELERGRIDLNFNTKEELASYIKQSAQKFTPNRLHRQFEYLKNDIQSVIDNEGNYL